MTFPKPRRGWDTCAAMLRHMQLTPSTTQQMGETFDMGRCVVRSTLERMHDLGLVRHAGWARTTNCGPHAVVWGFADGRPDEPRPSRKPGPARDRMLRDNRRPLLLAFANTINAMRGQVSVAEIVATSGVSVISLYEFLEYCRAINLVRVGGYARRSMTGSQTRLFTLGSEPDAPRPSPMTRQDYWRRSSAKRKAARAQIRQQKARLRAKMASVPSSIWRAAEIEWRAA